MLTAMMVKLVLAQAGLMPQPAPLAPSQAQPAQPAQPAQSAVRVVTVRCHEACAIKLDGRLGRRVDEKTWEVEGVGAGSKKLEAMSAANSPIFVGWLELPQGNARVELDEKGKASVASGGPVARALPPPPPPPPSVTGLASPPMVAAPGGPSLVRVRCQSECTPKVAGSGGRRVNAQLWEFDNVKPGQARVDAEGFAGMKQAGGFVDVPPSSEVEVVISSGRVAMGTVKPREAQAKAASGGPSTIIVNCAKSCTVFMDGQRRSGESVSVARIPNVTPGRHIMQVKYLGGSAMSDLDVPGDSEVFVVPGESSVRVTATKPLPQ